MNDQDRFDAANQNAELVTRIANAVAHRDHRRTNPNGGNEGDDMTPLERMRFAFAGQPKAARYDGDSESAPAREPRCTCGHPQSAHSARIADSAVRHCLGLADGSWCKCLHYEPDTTRALHSDPTGNAGTRPDRASADLKRWDAIQRQIATLANEGADLLAKYGPARVASDADRAALAKANVVPEPGCVNCGKHGHWQPVDPRRPNLANCRWCNEWRLATDTDPGKRECDMHADGKTVRRPDANHVNRKASA